MPIKQISNKSQTYPKIRANNKMVKHQTALQDKYLLCNAFQWHTMELNPTSKALYLYWENSYFKEKSGKIEII